MDELVLNHCELPLSARNFIHVFLIIDKTMHQVSMSKTSLPGGFLRVSS